MVRLPAATRTSVNSCYHRNSTLHNGGARDGATTGTIRGILFILLLAAVCVIGTDRHADASWSGWSGYTGCPSGQCTDLDTACASYVALRGGPSDNIYLYEIRKNPTGYGLQCIIANDLNGPSVPGIFALYYDPTSPHCASSGDRHQGAQSGCVTQASQEDNPERSCSLSNSTTKSWASNNPVVAAGNPVLVLTGSKFERAIDFTTGGPDSLAFIRYYHGASRDSTAAFGMGWRHNFSDSLVPENGSWSSPNWIEVHRSNGQVVRFTKSGSVYVPPSDQDMSLVQVSSDWEFTDANDLLARFNSTGTLLYTEKPNGYRQTLTYTSGQLTSVTDSYGRTLSFTYYTSGDWQYLLAAVTAPDGQIYSYYFNGPFVQLSKVEYPDATPGLKGNNRRLYYHYEDSNFWTALTGITDEEGVRYATWAYDSNLRVTSSKHGSGNVDKVTFSYDDVNDIVTTTNTLGKQTKYHYATAAGRRRLSEVEGVASTNCVASDATYSYDANGYFDEVIDREGNSTTIVNNSRGLPTSITEADGTTEERETTYTWHSTFNKPTKIELAGQAKVEFTYDSSTGDLLTRTETDLTSHSVPYSTNGQTRTWTYTWTYNATNTDKLEKLEVDGPLSGTGDTTTYDYDSDGYLTKVTNALGQISDITSVNGLGQPLSITDPNGVETDFLYHPRGFLLSITVDPSGLAAVTRFTYDDLGQITRMDLPDGTALNYTYDDARRLTKISNDSGESITFTVDDLGNVTQEQTRDASGTLKKTLSRTFDELGRTLTYVGAGSQTTTFGYDKNDLLKTVTDPRSNVTTNSFDALNRLVTVTDALTNDADNGFDSADNLETVTDQRGFDTTFVHNGFGEPIRRTSPDTGITDYEYDAAGNMTKRTDARGVITNYTYDNLYRVTAKSFPASTGENVTYTWDDVTGGNKGKGRLTRIEDESGSTAYVYDALGRITKETRVIDTVTYVTEYAYDAAGNLTRMTYPSGRIVDYVRDSEGRVQAVTTKKNGTAATVVVASDIHYLPFGPISSLRLGNGLVTTLGYDQDYRLTAIDTTDGTTAVQDLDYTYGNGSGDAGNIRAIDDNLDSSLDQTFDYDAIYRLTDADGVYGTIGYAYDAVGNRTSRAITLGSTVTETSTYDTSSNRLLSVADGSTTRSLTYTANGNVTTDSRGLGFDYLYNNADRLATLKENSATVATYTYNDLGERVIKDLGSGDITHYVFDLSGTLIAESDENGTMAREYIHLAGLPLAIIDAGTSGTPTEIDIDNDDTDASSTGTWDSATDGTGYEGSDYQRRAGGDGSYSFVWTPTLSATNEYQVYVKWPDYPGRASKATFTVYHAGGSTDVTVDQRVGGGDWYLLGTFIMEPSQSHRVVLSDEAEEPANYDVVIDNNAANATDSGHWTNSNDASGGRFWGYNFHKQNVASTAAKFTWPARALSERGIYRVYARWPANSDQALHADYKVNYVGGSTTVTVNQRESGSQWNLLGTFELEPSLNPLVELSGYDGNGWLVADAIRVVRLKSDAAEDYVVDNEDSSVTVTGSWGTDTTYINGGLPIGANDYYAASGTGTKKVSWPLDVTVAGTYRVYARWKQASNRATNAQYTIYHDGGTTTVTLNQRESGGIWMLLGVFDLTPTSYPKVELTDNANGYVSADAVRAVLHTTAETEYIVDNGDTGTSETGSGWWDVGAYNADRGTFYGQVARGANDGTYTWPLDVPSAGQYQVYARWVSPSGMTAAAKYTVTNAGGTSDITYSQQVNGGVWMPLGLFDLAPSSGHKVVLSNAGSGAMVADAIKVVPAEFDTRVVSADAVKFVANDAEDVLYVHTDHLGAPQKITDAGRSIVWDAAFTPFGEEDSITGSATANWRFPGQYHDAEAALSYNYHRTYDPALGRYLQSDPIGLAGGLNTYAYVQGNPVSRTDPTGENPIAIGAGGGALVAGPPGAAVGAVIGGVALGGYLIYEYCTKDSAEDDKDACWAQYEGDRKQCLKNHSYNSNALSGCLRRAEINRDLCLRGKSELPPWSDGDTDGWTPPRPPKRYK